jgi:hypothetical protein
MWGSTNDDAHVAAAASDIRWVPNQQTRQGAVRLLRSRVHDTYFDS